MENPAQQSLSKLQARGPAQRPDLVALVPTRTGSSHRGATSLCPRCEAQRDQVPAVACSGSMRSDARKKPGATVEQYYSAARRGRDVGLNQFIYDESSAELLWSKRSGSPVLEAVWCNCCCKYRVSMLQCIGTVSLQHVPPCDCPRRSNTAQTPKVRQPGMPTVASTSISLNPVL